MPKRKRSSDSGLQAVLDKHQAEIFRALKAAKGFERQRQSKRLRDDGVDADKQKRLEREVAVLKALDLHQTARAHLISSLLKVKAIAASSGLPDELRAGVAKPDLPDDERAALHNVTSGLCNREPVKQAADRAVAAVCAALNVPVPDKAKRTRKNKQTDKVEQPADGISSRSLAEKPAGVHPEAASEDEPKFESFEPDVDEPRLAVAELDSEAEAAEETEFSKYNHLLGGSSDEEEEFDEEMLKKFKGREKANLDDVSLAESASNSESGHESEPSSHSPSPPPAKQRKKDTKHAAAAAKAGPATNSVFLPSLMGGYISGSDSASEVEEAKPKKRRGQRARQAIWEKKYGANAKHLQKQNQKGGRDAGWDMRRGAVDGHPQGRQTPWKKGAGNPLAKNSRAGLAGRNEAARKPEPKPARRDDEGPLHPSWVAKKKAQEAQKGVAFSGQKIVFD